MPGFAAVSWRPFAVPLRRPLVAAHGALTHRGGIVVRVETAGGVEGLGEASPLESFAGGTIQEILGLLPLATAALLNGSGGKKADMEAALERASPGARGALACALDTAVASVAAAEDGIPLWYALLSKQDARFVGGTIKVPVNALIGDCTPAEAIHLARSFVGAGYETLKLKAGFGFERDRDRLRAVRGVVGTEIFLRLDANGAWDEREARQMLEVAVDADVEILEQPLPDGPEAIAQTAALAADYPWVRVGLDESCRTVTDIKRMGEANPRLAAIIKPTVSGLVQAHQMMQVARGYGMDAIVTTTIEAGIGTTAAMHLAASVAGNRRACGLGTLDLLDGDIVTGVPPVVDGHVELRRDPGLGLALDEEQLERFATGPWTTVRA